MSQINYVNLLNLFLAKSVKAAWRNVACRMFPIDWFKFPFSTSEKSQNCISNVRSDNESMKEWVPMNIL